MGRSHGKRHNCPLTAGRAIEYVGRLALNGEWTRMAGPCVFIVSTDNVDHLQFNVLLEKHLGGR